MLARFQTRPQNYRYTSTNNYWLEKKKSTFNSIVRNVNPQSNKPPPPLQKKIKQGRFSIAYLKRKKKRKSYSDGENHLNMKQHETQTNAPQNDAKKHTESKQNL